MILSCRWRAALSLFVKFPIKCDSEPQRQVSKSSKTTYVSLTGCGTICHLPLPNNGEYSGTCAYTCKNYYTYSLA